MIPTWINPVQYLPPKPPPEVLELGRVRSGPNLLAVTRALCVTQAPRYAPDESRTWCNLFAVDALEILRAPLEREKTVNDLVLGLRAGRYAGWAKLAGENWAADGKTILSLANRAVCGLPTIATWLNLAGHGHIAIVVPPPANAHSGLYVTCAGRQRLQEQPIAHAFGFALTRLEFWGHD